MATATAAKPKTATPFGEPKNPPRCPVHGVRMQYDPELSELGGSRCPQKGGDGQRCTFTGYPKAINPTLLKSNQYTGAIRLFVQRTLDDNGETNIAVYLQLIDVGLLVDVTRHIDMDRGGILMGRPDNKPTGLDLVFKHVDMG